MSWRFIYIKNSNMLRLKLDSIIISQDGEDYSIPLEDINTILIEDNKCSITCKLLSRMMEYKIQLVICDNRMMPCGTLLPYGQYFREAKLQKIQTSLAEEVKDYLWKKIIEWKIENQRLILIKHEKNTEKIMQLEMYKKNVECGDITNREGHAAKIYFRALYGNNFIRHNEDTINSALNYGYSIIRSNISRIIAMIGFIPSLGFHHKNEFNSFNLADDMIEVYRPLVDSWVYENVYNKEMELNRDIKMRLINILNGTVVMNGKKYTVSSSIEAYVKGFASYIQSGDERMLVFPDITLFTEYEV